MRYEIKCPKCNTSSVFSIVASSFQGPYRCWKCRETFKIKIENDQLVSTELLTPEEKIAQSQIEAARAKTRGYTGAP